MTTERDALASALMGGDDDFFKDSPPEGATKEVSTETPPEDSPDPFKEVKLEDLLKHPTLGKEIQSHMDKSAAAQFKSQQARLEQQITQQVSAQKEEELLEKYFGTLTREELGQRLAEDPELAARYSELQRKPEADREAEIEKAATYKFYLREIQHWSGILKESGLDNDAMSKLSPENYAQDANLEGWISDIQKAIIEQAVSKAQKEALETQFEAFKQERLAEEESTSPGALLRVGSRTSPVPDLMDNDSYSLLEDALQNPKRR